MDLKKVISKTYHMMLGDGFENQQIIIGMCGNEQKQIIIWQNRFTKRKKV